DTVVHTIRSEERTRLDEIEVEIEDDSLRRYTIRDGDPLSAAASVEQRMALRRGPWAVRIECRASCSATREAFTIRARVDAFEGETLVRTRMWEHDIPRDSV